MEELSKRKTKKRVRKSKENTAFPRKLIIIGFAILLQLAIIILLSLDAFSRYTYVYYISIVLSLLTVLRVVYSKKNSSSRISWIIFILVFQPFGVIAYFLWGETTLPRYKRRKMLKIKNNSAQYLHKSDIDALEAGDRITGELKFIQNLTGYSPHTNVAEEYFAPCDSMFDRLCEELEKAEKYIFIEFFIVADGKLLERINEILFRKAAAGVEVKFLIDDYGCKTRFSSKTRKDMKKAGIQIRRFNVVRPLLDFFMNYRDHKKIVVIDGRIAFTGGMNLADEYANIIQRFGHWRDAGVCFEGASVNDFAVMFLRNWEYVSRKPVDYPKYLINYSEHEEKCTEASNLVCAFESGPVDPYSVSKNLFSKIICDAKKYIYIQTPYLVIEDSLINDLLKAARSGVDVKIFMPGIPDKKLIFKISRTHYKRLMEAGVGIYEYTPGFLHSKVLLSDDECAFVGTINMDYRSFYQQYECGAYISSAGAVRGIKADFEELLSVSAKVDKSYLPRFFLSRLFLSIVGLFAPLM